MRKWNTDRAKVSDVALQALHEAAEIIAKEAMEEVPYATGDLASHIMVHDDPSSATVYVAASGPYAVKQHEDATLRHPDPTNPASRSGRKHHYLEDPFLRNQKNVLNLISEKIDKQLR